MKSWMRWMLSAGLVLAVLTVVVRSANPSPDVKTEMLRMKPGEEFLLDIPSAWKLEVPAGSDAQGDAFRISSSDESSVFLVSLVPLPPGSRMEGPEDLEKLLTRGAQSRPGSQQNTKITALSFHSPYCYGLYATSVDSRYLNEKPPRGQFRFSTLFVLNCQDRALTVTFLTNEEPFDSLDLAVMVLKSLRRKG